MPNYNVELRLYIVNRLGIGSNVAWSRSSMQVRRALTGPVEKPAVITTRHAAWPGEWTVVCGEAEVSWAAGP